MRPGLRGTTRAAAVWLCVVGGGLGWLGCPGPSGEEVAPEDPAALEARLEGRLLEYAAVLSHAYASGDIEALRPYAVERVLAQVHKRVSDLTDQGLSLEAELRELIVEDVRAWGNDFALVTTFETWDLRYYSTGAHTIVSERLATKNRVEYQMKVRDGAWMVFHRELKQEIEGG